MNTLIWNVIEQKYESTTGSMYSEESAQEMVDCGIAKFCDDVQELDFND